MGKKKKSTAVVEAGSNGFTFADYAAVKTEADVRFNLVVAEARAACKDAEAEAEKTRTARIENAWAAYCGTVNTAEPED